MDQSIGIDVGGTKIQGVVITRTGRIVKQVRIATKAQSKKEDIISDIVGLIKLLNNKQVIGIGIGFPSVVDLKNGVLLDTANIKSLQNVNIIEKIKKYFRKPVYIENDANCFVIAEHMFGSGHGKDDLVGITLGTGIGSGIISNGKVVHGKSYSAGEIGHIMIIPNGRRGYASLRGSFEQYAAGKGIQRTYGEVLEEHKKPVVKSSTFEIFKLAKEGDIIAKECLDRTYEYLAIGFSIVANMLDPELIVVGGGLAKNMDFVRVNKLIQKHSFFSRTRAVKSKLTNLAPAIGAGALVFVK